MAKYLVSIGSDAAPGGYAPYFIEAESKDEAYENIKDELGGPFHAYVLHLFEVKG